MSSKTPSKRWRVTYLYAAIDHRSERAAYDAVNELAGNVTPAELGKQATIHHWEDGRWVLYERVKLTEGGWEPA